ncbi:MAG: fumarylacetoacetate hydrolase family protein [Planctomycetota bacterium]|nr:MAG: fumarylacetoacetate hydrolase family protein [Planctomycetota bacterium]
MVKFVTVQKPGQEGTFPGIVVDSFVLDLTQSLNSGKHSPSTMLEWIQLGEEGVDHARKMEVLFREGKIDPTLPLETAKFKAPLPNPVTLRDAYAFENHVKAGRASRGLAMIPEFYQFPVFYYSNPLAIFGPGKIPVQKDHLWDLDFELEAAVVIGKRGKNISSEKADSWIFGYMIMNDFSTRGLQRQEMKLNLGPAKGKDFATAFGPYLVTPDELSSFLVEENGFNKGSRYNLVMKAFHNGKQVSEGNLKDMTFTFAEIIERASYGTELHPGEVIGSGTVGTGCFLELNGTAQAKAKREGRKFEPTWLKNGDEICLEITGLGRLSNTIELVSDYSLLDILDKF